MSGRERSRDRGSSRDGGRDRGGPPPVSDGKLFIGNLSYDATESDLMDAFSRYGRVESTKIIVDREMNKPRGFGFVTFVNGRDADVALVEMRDFELKGRRIRVDSCNNKDGNNGGGRGARDASSGEGYHSGPPRQERATMGPCYSFRDGLCKYGDRCKFSHDGPGSGPPVTAGRGDSKGDRSGAPRDNYGGGSRDGGRDNYGGGSRDAPRDSGRDNYSNGGGGRDSYNNAPRDNYNNAPRDNYNNAPRDNYRGDNGRESGRDNQGGGRSGNYSQPPPRRSPPRSPPRSPRREPLRDNSDGWK